MSMAAWSCLLTCVSGWLHNLPTAEDAHLVKQLAVFT
jgi:hypothetical protein